MADSKLSALTELAAAPASTDEIYINDGGVSKKITVANLLKANEEVIASIAFSDETTALTTGTAKATFHMPPWATTLTNVIVGMTTAPTGSAAIFDLNEAGVSVLSTKVTVDVSEFNSEDATTPPVVSDSALAANAKMTVDIDQIGSTVAGTGGKMYLIGNKA